MRTKKLVDLNQGGYIVSGVASSVVFLIVENSYYNVLMNALQQERTSFVVAHRLSTIRKADQIVVVNHGKIIEIGNHESLMNKKGFYANLYNSQFAGNN